MKRKKLGFFICLFSCCGQVQAKTSSADVLKYVKALDITSESQMRLLNFQVVKHTKVETYKVKTLSKQKMQFMVMGLKAARCRKVFRRISRYEMYHQWIGFIQNSSYDDKKGQVYFAIKTSPLPLRFVLLFKIPRITGPGNYPFSFDKGFLAGLKGKIQVVQIKKHCFVHAHGTWDGQDTGYLDELLELFSDKVLGDGLERLLRLSEV